MSDIFRESHNVQFSQERFIKHDYIGCEAVKHALFYFTGELKDNEDKYGIDLIQTERKYAIEVEHCGIERWSQGAFPPKLCPPDIPLRKEDRIIEALNNGWKYAYSWVRNDCRFIMVVWLDQNRFNQCGREIRNTKYKENEPFLLPQYAWFQYISVPRMYWSTN